MRKVDDRIISKARSKLDGDLDPLLSISWDLYSSVPVRKETCSCIQKPSARRLWAVFNKLDTGRESLVDIDDIADLVSKLYSNAGQEEETKEMERSGSRSPSSLLLALEIIRSSTFLTNSSAVAVPR